MKSLINDNWEKMSIILDREIPQKENRRRMFIFWWSIAAGLAIPIIFMITLKFSNFKGTENISTVYKEDSITSKVEESNTKTMIQNSISSKGINNIANIMEAKNETYIPDNIITPKNILMKANTGSMDKSSNSKKELGDIQSKTESNPTEVLELQIADGVSFNSIPNNEHSKSALISSLPIKAIFELLKSSRHPILSGKIQTPKNKFSYGVEVAALTHDYNKLMATSAGLVGGLAISPKWSLTTGIRLNRFHNSSPYYSKNDVIVQSTLFKENYDSETYTASVNINEKETNVLRQYIINNITEHLDYAELSIGISYNLNSCVSITSAFMTGINIGAKYSQNLDADQVLTNYSTDKLSQSTIDEIGLLHNKYMCRLRVGVDFRLYRHLFLVSRADIFTNKKPDLNSVISSSAPLAIANQNIINLNNNEHVIGLELGLKYCFSIAD